MGLGGAVLLSNFVLAMWDKQRRLSDLLAEFTKRTLMHNFPNDKQVAFLRTAPLITIHPVSTAFVENVKLTKNILHIHVVERGLVRDSIADNLSESEPMRNLHLRLGDRA